MGSRRYDALVLAIVMLMTTISPLILMGAEVGGLMSNPEPPVDYHPGFIHLNVTQHNGTPADGFYVVHYNTRLGNYERSTVYLDEFGAGSIYVRFNRLGSGVLYMEDGSGTRRYWDELTLDPDQNLFLNITLGTPPDPYNTVTGILQNGGTGEAISGYEVRLNGRTEYMEDFVLYNTTDSSGRFTFQVPNVTRSMVSLYASQTQELHYANEYLFLLSGQSHYEVPLYMHPRFSMDVETRARFILDPEGTPLTGGFEVQIYAKDHGFAQMNTQSSGPDGQGWYTFNGSEGEGYMRMTSTPPQFHGASIVIYSRFIHNGTETDIEVPVSSDLMVPVNVEVTNSTDPIDNLYISYYHRGVESYGKYSVSFGNTTDENGTTTLWVPRGIQMDVDIVKIPYKAGSIHVDTTVPGPYEYSLELEPIDEFVPPVLTNLSVTILDSDSGIPVPAAKIYGSHLMGSSYTLDVYSDNDGEWTGKAYSGDYYYFDASSGIGHEMIEKVELLPDQDNILTMRLNRAPKPVDMDIREYHFYLKDIGGTPLPDTTLILDMMVDKWNKYGVPLTSDSSGKIDVRVVEGSSIDVDPIQWMDGEVHEWAPIRQTITTPMGGGELPDIVMYQRTGFSSITGFITDSATGEPIPEAKISCTSVQEVNDPSREKMVVRDLYMDGPEFSFQMRNSLGNGYYRTWASNTGLLRIDVPGYFPYATKVYTVPIRGEFTQNVFLDPLVEERAWINGTLVDQNADPMTGFVNITDKDHPAMGGIDVEVNGTGMFSIETYPGNFLIRYYNGSLEDTMEITLTVDGMEDLELKLIPSSMITGTVVDGSGTPQEGINVTLHKTLVNSTMMVSCLLTDSSGDFSFEVTEGEYSIIIERSDLFERYTVSSISVTGWNDWFDILYLNNRTQADVVGAVMGSAGPYTDGIPGVNVTIYDGNDVVANTETDLEGNFHLVDVDHGIYTLYLEPPRTLRRVEGFRSGYLDSSSANFSVSGPLVEVEAYLEYVFITPPGYVNVTFNGPNGTDVYLDEPIEIEFSEVMDEMMTEGSFFITPEVDNLTFVWDEMGYLVSVGHDPFLPNTTYVIEIGAGATSMEGWPIWNDGFSWTFTTGVVMDPWDIDVASVSLDDMDLMVNVTAPENLTIFICILNIGYFELPYEDGSYYLLIPGVNFEHDTTYQYYFTNMIGGLDRAPGRSGTFTTPVEPYVEPEWEIFYAEVTLTSISGDWEIEVEATEGADIFVVIPGIGSFRLTEGPPGNYSTMISYDNFEEGETYHYHFSNVSDGDDLASSFSGSRTQPVYSGADDDDEGWDTTSCCTVFLIVIVAILLLVILMIVIARMRKGSSDDAFEE